MATLDSDKARTSRDFRIRPLRPADRSRIHEMIVSSGKFTEVEVAVALELVDAALTSGHESGYIVAVLEEGREELAVRGYVCYGPTPLTDGVYDLYWIVVDLPSQGRGFGQRLLEHVERDVVARGGRMLLIETSSQQTYGATIRFYERSGYDLTARVKDFYRIGDDKLIFFKNLK
jgi:ribosomal protein S18 acetylase RimI-like enzyme